jgi:N6-adenosine-specific RNA methylase IME4
VKRYRTVVADPPWALEWNANVGNGRSGRKGLPYSTMTVEEIASLAVPDLACGDAHLWLWTTHGFLWDAPRVALSWGFRPTYMLTWAKPGLGVGARFRHTCEYLLFCERGAQLPITRRDLPTHFTWPRGEHSVKPEAFYDLVESVSPTPRLELFARRARLGWDYAGDGSLGTVQISGLRTPEEVHAA